MNPEAQLVESLKRFNQDARENNIRFYYGKVISVDMEKDTCTVEVQEEGLKAVVNLRVGQQELPSAFVIYPKTGTQILFLSENEAFGRAYMLTCSKIKKVKIITSPKEAAESSNDAAVDPVIELNGSALGGLISIADLTTKINTAISTLNTNITNLKNFVEAAKTAFDTHTHVATALGSPTGLPVVPPIPPDPIPPNYEEPDPTPVGFPANPATSDATSLKQEDYENTSVTHDSVLMKQEISKSTE